MNHKPTPNKDELFAITVKSGQMLLDYLTMNHEWI